MNSPDATQRNKCTEEKMHKTKGLAPEIRYGIPA
jgi:hypothetical protein